MIVEEKDTLGFLCKIEGATRPYYTRTDGLYYIDLETNQEHRLFESLDGYSIGELNGFY